jgi:surface protein
LAIGLVPLVLIGLSVFFGFFSGSVAAYPADEFVTTWKTDNPGTSNSTSITIPTTGTGYNYQVDWDNDGVFDQSGITGNVTHDFGSAGTKTIRIKGSFPRIYFNNTGDKSKILSVEQWGTNAWTSMNRSFYGASNLVINAADTPNLTSVTDMQLMFQEAASLGGGTGNWSWNTSTVTNMTQLFQGAVNFNKDITSWNTSNVTTLSGMFRNAYVFNQNISTWNTSNVTNMYYMFGNATSFNQPIGIWNTSKVTDMGNMFDVATSFNQPIGTWDTSKVTGMYRMFIGASDFNQPLSSWDTSKVENMFETFRQAPSFNQDLSTWDVSAVNTAFGMFSYGGLSTDNYDALLTGWSAQTLKPNVPFDGGNSKYCNATAARATLTSAPNNWTVTDGGLDCSKATKAANTHFVTTWKTDNPGTSNSTSITIPTTGAGYSYDVDWDNDGRMDEFGITGSKTHDFGTAGTKTIRIQGTFPRIYFNNTGDKSKILSVEQWGTNAWTSMYYAFYGANNLVVNASDTPNLSSVTDMTLMFRGATALGGGTGNWNWNTSNVSNMTQVFFQASSFNKPIGSWDTSNVTNMNYMFGFATVFNQDISSWNTSKVINMSFMFDSASSFNQPVGSWDTSKVTTMQFMFYRATVFNQPLGSWDVSKVTNMYAMFNSTTAFNQPLNSWNTGSVTTMGTMFAAATAFNQPIGTWDTSQVTNMQNMFYLAASFNQPLGNWNVGNVTNMQEMFRAASSFNGSVDAWDTSKVTNMQLMFYLATNFNQPLNSWDVSKVTTMYAMFNSAPAFNQPLNSWNTSSVTSTLNMFANATSFNQNLSTWNVANVTNASGMFTNATLSTQNYDAILNGWNAQTLKPNITFSGGNSKYCAASAARANMLSSDNWTITDGGQDCSQAKPTDVKLAGSHTKAITENNAVNASMGTLTVTDLTPSDTHSYAFTCTTAGADDASVHHHRHHADRQPILRLRKSS